MLSLALIAAITFLAALSGGIFKPGAWYAALNKPSWVPKNWVFPVVWTLLYALMAISAWFVWQASASWLLMGVYGAHLVLNFLWSALFFGARKMRLAGFEVIALWLSIALMIALFAPVSPLAAWLLVPYIAWVTIAAALNWSMVRLNPVEASK